MKTFVKIMHPLCLFFGGFALTNSIIGGIALILCGLVLEL